VQELTDYSYSSAKETKKDLDRFRMELVTATESLQKEREAAQKQTKELLALRVDIKRRKTGSDQSSPSAKETRRELEKLKRELAATNESLKKERSMVEEQKDTIQNHQDQIFQLEQKANRLVEVEQSLAETQKALEAVEDEKIAQVVLQQECEVALEKMSDIDYEKQNLDDSHVSTVVELEFLQEK